MNETTGNNQIINFLLEENEPLLDSYSPENHSIISPDYANEDNATHEFLIHDMFLDHFFP